MPAQYVPATDSLADLDLTYIAFERVVLSEFMQCTVEKIYASWGDSGIQDLYNSEDHWKLRQKFNHPMDPLFFLGSYVDIPDGKIRTILPFDQDLRLLAKTVRSNRNLWAHYDAPDQRLEVLAAIAKLRLFSDRMALAGAKATGMKIETRLREISASRARQIGGISNPAQTSATVEPVPSETVGIVSENTPSRPRIGGAWTGKFPSREIVLSEKHQDALDHSGNSVTKPLGALGKSIIRRWLNLEINSWLYVDPRDGATVALVNGDPHLIGYLGEEPKIEPSEYRGFFAQGTFENANGRLVEIGTSTPFTSNVFSTDSLTAEWVDANIPSEASVRFTDYGDVVLIDEDGPRRIATLEEKF